MIMNKKNTFALHLYKKSKIENLADNVWNVKSPQKLILVIWILSSWTLFRAMIGLSCIDLQTA